MPGEKPLEARTRTNNKLNPLHIGGRQALSPLHHPYSPLQYRHSAFINEQYLKIARIHTQILRMVPSFVTAHTFCEILGFPMGGVQGYFCVV